jgi:predicted CoA-substrate-specific enzyme activase
VSRTNGIGLDVGSTTTKGVLLDADKAIISKSLIPTGASASEAIGKILQRIETECGQPLDDLPIISTGYGRKQVDSAIKSVTEITCHAVGVHSLNPEIRFIVDVGGQDSKVIRLSSKGRPEDFELNDKCSAGTGRFLEVMAGVLEVSIDELGPLALQSDSPSTISSTCTVFAESEVIGHIGSGESPSDIAAGIHASMTAKIGSLARRVGVVEPVCVTGGVALNPAFRKHLSEHLDVSLWLPEFPQFTGAIGAGILAMNET